MNDKFSMFGKVYLQYGNTSSNLCLATSGDVKIKTPNRYITIFKQGKLVTDTASLLFKVEDESEITKDGIYLILKDDTKQVILNLENEQISLGSDSNSLISFIDNQELTEELLILVLKNIGISFPSLEEAKKSNIKNGLVYITNTSEIYKVVNKEFIPLITKTTSSQTTKAQEDIEIPPVLKLNNLIINGNNASIEGDNILIITNSGLLLTLGNDLLIHKNIVLSNNSMISVNNSLNKGLLVKTDATGKSTMMVDDLIVRNDFVHANKNLSLLLTDESNKITKILKISDRLEKEDLEETNIIKENSIKKFLLIDLESPNTFNIGDWIALQSVYRNSIYILEKLLPNNTPQYTLEVSLDLPLEKDTTVEILFRIGDTEEVSTEEEDNQLLSNQLGNFQLLKWRFTLEKGSKITQLNLIEPSYIYNDLSLRAILNIDIISGEKLSTEDDPIDIELFTGKVVETSPVTILFNMNIDNVSFLEYMVNLPIYKIADTSNKVLYFTRYLKNGLSLQSFNKEKLEFIEHVSIGNIPRNQTIAPGIFSEFLIAKQANIETLNITKNIPRLDYTLAIPLIGSYLTTALDRTLPSVSIVKELINKLALIPTVEKQKQLENTISDLTNTIEELKTKIKALEAK